MNEIQKLESIMAKGKFRYVILHGVVLWGLLTATLILLIRVVLGEDLTAVSISLNYIIFPLAGIFWGLFMWTYLTRRFQRLNQDRPPEPESEPGTGGNAF